MGEPTRGNARVPHGETIAVRGARGELKHLSTLRKRKHSPSSGERKGNSPNRRRAEGCSRCDEGVVSRGGVPTRTHKELCALGEEHWKGSPQGVRVPYPKGARALPQSLSTTGHANPVGSRGVQTPRLNTLSDR